jgi:mRNA interferase RelE/StbE
LTYTILIRPVAQKQLDRLKGFEYKIVTSNMYALGLEPRPPKVLKLVGSPLWRVRIRDFRVIYSIDDREKTITIRRIARRHEDSYDGL